jgi:peptide chain release factor 1
MLDKLKQFIARYQEIDRLMQDPNVLSNPAKVGLLMKEQGQLKKYYELHQEIEQVRKLVAESKKVMAEEKEPELRQLAEEDLQRATAEEAKLIERMEELLLDEPSDADRGVIIEIRPGTGGEEAALFAGDLFRMYSKYIERKGWSLDIIELSESSLKGIKSATFTVRGTGAWRALKWEGGTHRVQRVPATEASGRIHTSAATVAVLPEAEDVDIELKPQELKIDTACSGGPGGQHVNKTESKVIITHLPTGITVYSQTDRSQHRNRELAMMLLKAKLKEHYDSQKNKEQSNMRKAQIGTGDRSEKIRTYNFPQNRVTDHRIEFTSHRLEEILAGGLDELTEALMAAEKKKKVEALHKEQTAK